MSYQRYHAILVTGSYDCDPITAAATRYLGCHGFHWAAVARRKASKIFGDEHVSELIETHLNNVVSFFVAPDGSNEGWDDSDKGDDNRDAFIEWLESLRYDDGSSPLAWAEVQYGDDEGVTKIVRDSDEKQRENEVIN